MTEPAPRVVNWDEVKATLLRVAVAFVVLVGAVAYGFWGGLAAFVVETVFLCLALGFWITEQLIGVFTQTRTRSPTAILLIFSGKLAWWAGVLLAARHMPPGLDRAVGLGIGSFLLALLIAMLRHYGMPRISDGNPPQAP